MTKKDEMTQRRALIQKIKADRTMIEDIENLRQMLGDSDNLSAKLFRDLTRIVQINSEKRILAEMQLVRMIETRYNLKQKKY